MLIQNERTRRCTGTGRFFWDERIIEKRGQWLELIFIFLTLILEILVLAILLVLLIVELLIVLVLLIVPIVELLIVRVLLIVPIVELLIVLVLLRHSFHLPSRTTDAAGSPGCSLKNVHP